MTINKSFHMNRLEKLLEGMAESKNIYACVRDLVSNGLVLSRFTEGESAPNRQDITQFMAAWLRHIGLSADECRNWLIKYCVDVLSDISSSSPSQIRHSTRSNIKYIYRYEVELNCGCEKNPFKAACTRECPVYEQMKSRYGKGEIRKPPQPHQDASEDRTPPVPWLPVKKIYREQFEKALEFIKENLKQGVPVRELVPLLKEHDFKTRTGRMWTVAVIRSEIVKNNWSHLVEAGKAGLDAQAPSGEQDGAPATKVKDLYREQFENALRRIEENLKKGVSLKRIVALLTEEGFKTRTGKHWTIHTVRTEIQRNNLAS